MGKKKLYLYNAKNEPWSRDTNICPGAITTIPLESECFERIPGCATGQFTSLLTKKNIGKRFHLWILDPVYIGEVTFVGAGKKYIPSYILEKMNQEDFFRDYPFAVFTTDIKNKKEYIVVNIHFSAIDHIT